MSEFDPLETARTFFPSPRPDSFGSGIFESEALLAGMAARVHRVIKLLQKADGARLEARALARAILPALAIERFFDLAGRNGREAPAPRWWRAHGARRNCTAGGSI